MTTAQLNKLTKKDLVAKVEELQKSVQSTNDKLKRAQGSTKKADTVRALGETFTLKAAADKIETLDARLEQVAITNTQLTNELVSRDEFIEAILEKYGKLKEFVENIKEFIESQQPYYFISLRKYVKTVKYIYEQVRNLLSKDED